MAVLGAVMTGPGTGAIATIQLFGDAAGAILKRVFVPAGGKAAAYETGAVLLGHIAEDGRTVDEVVIGCESRQTFSIHCHGNPLIVDAIVKHLRRCGVEIVSGQQLLSKILVSQDPDHPISIEAKLALTAVKTIAGATLINNQVCCGLTSKAQQWERQLESGSIEPIRREVTQVLSDSRVAQWIIEGCTIALIGPPNAGKSTLLNTLAGREKAIVTDIEGTTRDWVSADIHIPPLAATLIDTAGLDSGIGDRQSTSPIAKVAQEKTIEILHEADLVLLVLDRSLPRNQVCEKLAQMLADKRAVTVLNKADLPARFDPAALPSHLKDAVSISAKTGSGITELIAAIRQVLGVAGFDLHTPVAFTPRQHALLEQLAAADPSTEAVSITRELLRGELIA